MSNPTPPADTPDVPEEDRARASSTGEELPPLPDGGLSGTMPAWLQQAPSRPTRTHAPETVDLSSLTEGIELPEWLSELSRRVEAGSAAERTSVGEGDVPSRPSSEPSTTVETGSEEDRPLAEAVIEGAPEVGDPETALDEPGLAEEAEAQAAEVESESAPEAPEPALRFQVRNVARTFPDLAAEAQPASPQFPPEPRYQMRAPAPQPPRSIGATILLVLLLIALAAVGVWYYGM